MEKWWAYNCSFMHKYDDKIKAIKAGNKKVDIVVQETKGKMIGI